MPNPTTNPLPDLGEALDDWRQADVLVVGAGPSGSVTALELAKLGVRVVVCEKSLMPRWKVCGACLTEFGAHSLRELGLSELLDKAHDCKIRRVRLRFSGGAERRWKAPPMHAISRGALDAALLDAARLAGARVLTNARAAPAPEGRVTITRENASVSIHPRAVVLATGLGGRGSWGLDDPRVRKASRMGIGSVCAWRDEIGDPRDLLMIVGRDGYVGCVRTEDGLANWAAAVDRPSVLRAGSPGAVVRALVEQSGIDPALAPTEGWRGTPGLTRSRRVQSGRVFAVGDAAGYVEPITGEGISWAIASARALAPIVASTLRAASDPSVWLETHRRLLLARQRRCAAVAWAVRHPRLLRVATLASRHGSGAGMLGAMISGGTPRSAA